MSNAPLILGAVAYDPKVVTIWEGFRTHFDLRGFAFDYVLYSNYEALVAGQFAGHCDVAWNSPLAWIEAERLGRKLGRETRAIAMRDTDRNLKSVIVARKESGIASITDLKGRRVAVGAYDSPQASLIPLEHIASAGLSPGEDFEVAFFNVAVGKHGDHIGGERNAARAMMAGDAEACCILDYNRVAFSKEGVMPAGATFVLAETAPFDHCNFTVLDDAPSERIETFVELLLDMSFDDPDVRPLLTLEGLKQWLPGRITGYAALSRAVDHFNWLEKHFPIAV